MFLFKIVLNKNILYKYRVLESPSPIDLINIKYLSINSQKWIASMLHAKIIIVKVKAYTKRW